MVTGSSKNRGVAGAASGGGDGLGGGPEIDLTQLVEILIANCDKLLDITTVLTEADLEALCTKLIDLTAALEAHTTANADALAELCGKIETLCTKISDQGQEQCDKLESIIKELQAIKACLITKEIVCEGGPTGVAEVYTNADNTNEMAVSVGAGGDIKIESGSGDGSDAAITAYIAACLASGSAVSLSWVTSSGDTGAATLLPNLPANTPFPNLYNATTSATGTGGKVGSMRAQCLSEPQTVEALCVHDLKSYAKLVEICASLNQMLTKLCEPSVLDDITCETCITGGATPETANCYRVPSSWLSYSMPPQFDRCTTSIAGTALQDSYTQADFEAALPAGSVIVPQADGALVYTSGVTFCLQRACFTGPIGQISRVCLISTPNTEEPVTKKFLHVLGKYDEPIGNTLQGILDKSCEIANNTAISAAKDCLILEALTTTVCPTPLTGNALPTSVTLGGDQRSAYPEGQPIQLTTATGANVGTAIVASSVYNEDTNATTVSYQSVTLEPNATLAQAVSAKPVSNEAVTALQTISAIKARRT